MLHREIETMKREELERIQEKKLKRLVRYCYQKIPFYRKLFKENNVEPDDIKRLEDLSKLPFTVKDHLRENYPFGMLAVDMKEVVRVHASSGTTGKPTVVAYTQNDIEWWSNLMARCLATAGATKDDIMHVAYGYGLFTGGLGFHYGGEKLGLTVVPSSVGNTKRQIMLIKDFGATILACTPSYALYISEVAKKEGLDPSSDFKLRLGFFGAEPWSESMRKKIEESLGLKAIDIYGMSELCGPGVSVECEHQNGLHIWEDSFIVEVIDPETGEVLDEGEKGELVFTTLDKEAMPLIRYRTRDISVVTKEECECGRTHARMLRVQGRSDDMLKIRGVNVFPSQIEHVLMGIEGVGESYLIVVDRDILDKLTVKVEMSEKFFNNKKNDVDILKKKIEEELNSALGIKVEVELAEPNTLPRFEGKAKRIVDLRKEKGIF